MIFWNGEILNNQENMLGDAANSFGCVWMKQGIRQLGDLWDEQGKNRRTMKDLSRTVGERKIQERRDGIIVAIPTEWSLQADGPIEQGEWIANCTPQGHIDKVFQCTEEGKGVRFRTEQAGILYRNKSDPYVELPTGQLHRLRVATTCGDLKTMELIPREKLGLVHELTFDAMEWTWPQIKPMKEAKFYNYSAKMAYRIGLQGKKQSSRLIEKQRQLGLTKDETNAAIKLQWDKNKPPKLQFFAWQCNSGGLPTRSWAANMGFSSICVNCNASLSETLEHCLHGCRYPRRVWKKFEEVRHTLGLPRKTAWREIVTGIPPRTRSPEGDYTPSTQQQTPAWDVLRVAITWEVWCARNNKVFNNKDINVTEICHLAWRDTIHAGMARRTHLLKSYQKSSDKRKVEIELEFSKTWGVKQFFCQGSFKTPKWNLAPILTTNPNSLPWDAS